MAVRNLCNHLRSCHACVWGCEMRGMWLNITKTTVVDCVWYWADKLHCHLKAVILQSSVHCWRLMVSPLVAVVCASHSISRSSLIRIFVANAVHCISVYACWMCSASFYALFFLLLLLQLHEKHATSSSLAWFLCNIGVQTMFTGTRACVKHFSHVPPFVIKVSACTGVCQVNSSNTAIRRTSRK